MSFLDLYPDLQRDSFRNATRLYTPPTSPSLASDMGVEPAAIASEPQVSYHPGNEQTFAEAYQSAWDTATLFDHATAFANARTRVVSNRARELEKLTGDTSLQPILATKGIEGFNERLSQLARTYPEYADQLQPWSEDFIAQEGIKLSKEAREAAKELGMRPATWASWTGGALGGAAAWPTDIVNFITGLAGVAAPAQMGIIAAFGTEALIGGASQIATEVLGAPYHETVEPGYLKTAEPYTNIAGQTVLGGVFGAAIPMTAAVYRRFFKTRPDLPPPVRDAGNVIESEEFTQTTNPLKEVPEGDAAHRAALGRAVQRVAKGEAVDVSDIITPEIQQRAREIMRAQLPGATEAEITQAIESGMSTRALRPTTFEAVPTVEPQAPTTAPLGRPPGRADPNAPDLASETLVQPRATDLAPEARVASAEERAAVEAEVLGPDAERYRALQQELETATAQRAEAQAAARRISVDTPENVQQVLEQTDIASKAGKDAAKARKEIRAIEKKLTPAQAERLRERGVVAPPAKPDLEIRPHLKQALVEEMTPEQMARYVKGEDPELQAEVARNLDRLRVEKPDMKVPVGVDAEGKTIEVPLETMMKRVEEDELVAREVAACVGSQEAG